MTPIASHVHPLPGSGRYRILNRFEIALPAFHSWEVQEISGQGRTGAEFTWSPGQSFRSAATFLVADVTADVMEPAVRAISDEDIPHLDEWLLVKTEREWTSKAVDILGFGSTWLSEGGKVRSLVFSYLLAERGSCSRQVMENRLSAGLSKILIRSSYRTDPNCPSREAIESVYSGLIIDGL